MATIRGVPIDDSMLIPAPAPWPGDLSKPTLLYGGTFDPPHIAHVVLSARARDALFGDDGVLVYVPAGRSPHKATGPVAPAKDRVAMLELATADDNRAVVWTDEIDRAEESSPSFWVDTLARAASLLPAETPLRFLIGSDQAEAFARWHEHETILRLAEPAVLLREPCASRECFRRALLDSGMDPASWMPRIVETEIYPVASTGLRELLSKNIAPDDIIDPEVLTYACQHRLYSGGSPISRPPA